MKMKSFRFAAVAAVLLAFCLVFMMPVGATAFPADSGVECNDNSCDHIAEYNGKHYPTLENALAQAIASSTNKVVTIIKAPSTTVSFALSSYYNTDLNKFDTPYSGLENKEYFSFVLQGSPGVTLTHNIASGQGKTKFKDIIFRNLTFSNGAGIKFTPQTDMIDNVTIQDCNFTNLGSTPAIEIHADSTDIVENISIKGNEISTDYIGVHLYSPGFVNGTLTIDNNIIESKNTNGMQITWNAENLVITNNKITSPRPVNIAGITTDCDVTFTDNTITFPSEYNDNGNIIPTPAIYHVKGSIVLDDSNKFYYTNSDVALDYSSLMKHLYLEDNGAAIYVDSVKDENDGYYGGYVSVGFSIDDSNVVPEDANPSDLSIKSGYNIAKVHMNKDDGYGYHYIIGKDAQSNNYMKLTAGTFVTDPTAFIADGYHVKENDDGTFTVTDKWTVTFVGTETTTTSVTNNTKVGKPEVDPVKTGYKFNGWYNGDTLWNFDTDVVISDLTLNAKFTINKYTITFDTKGGSEIPAITQDYGTPVTYPTDPTKSGYKFDGWDTTIPATMPAEDMTITAKWVKKPTTYKPVEKPKEPVEPETPVVPETLEAGEATVETEVTDGGEVVLETPTEGGAVVADDDAKITGVVLPTGTDSEVTFIPISEQAAPEGKETQTKKVFEINVPTYEKGKPAVIKFQMTVAELAADGKEAADVALWHFDEETGEWTKLVTSYVIVDGVVYFEAITNGFSPFAIIYEDEPVDEPVDEPETPASPAPVLGLLAALGAAVVLRRK